MCGNKQGELELSPASMSLKVVDVFSDPNFIRHSDIKQHKCILPKSKVSILVSFKSVIAHCVCSFLRYISKNDLEDTPLLANLVHAVQLHLESPLPEIRYLGMVCTLQHHQ
jgi:hypothetical protein